MEKGKKQVQEEQLFKEVSGQETQNSEAEKETDSVAQDSERAEISSPRGKRICKRLGYVFFGLALLFLLIWLAILISTGKGSNFALFVVMQIAVLGWFTTYPLMLFSLLSGIFFAICREKICCIISFVMLFATLAVLVMFVCFA